MNRRQTSWLFYPCIQLYLLLCPMTADIYVTHMFKVIYVTYMQFLITAVLHVCNIYVEIAAPSYIYVTCIHIYVTYMCGNGRYVTYMSHICRFGKGRFDHYVMCFLRYVLWFYHYVLKLFHYVLGSFYYVVSLFLYVLQFLHYVVRFLRYVVSPLCVVVLPLCNVILFLAIRVYFRCQSLFPRSLSSLRTHLTGLLYKILCVAYFTYVLPFCLSEKKSCRTF